MQNAFCSPGGGEASLGTLECLNVHRGVVLNLQKKGKVNHQPAQGQSFTLTAIPEFPICFTLWALSENCTSEALKIIGRAGKGNPCRVFPRSSGKHEWNKSQIIGENLPSMDCWEGNCNNGCLWKFPRKKGHTFKLEMHKVKCYIFHWLCPLGSVP